MRIGVPKEIKPYEGRVGLIPAVCAELVRAGHELLVEAAAGAASGYDDESYRAAGVRVTRDAAELYAAAELIVKVKEPIAAELPLLRREHLLFSYLHLAALPELTQRLREIGLTAIGFETVEESDGRLPLLAPMSAIAGRLATQFAATLLHSPQGGKGILLGGVPAAPRGSVVVIGAGSAGGNAAAMAAALGAEVVVFDKNRERLERMRALGPNVTALYPYELDIAAAARRADVLIGAVLVTGARAPRVLSAAVVRTMQPGSVIVDISVDQGGCIETTRPTSYVEPTYVLYGVIHFAVTNIPGAVPRTASQALSAALAPFLPIMASGQWRDSPVLRRGLNIEAGRLVHPALATYSGSVH
ncbi:MAG: alanine dehydrogenase [Steroidobacterales bacterium]